MTLEELDRIAPPAPPRAGFGRAESIFDAAALKPKLTKLEEQLSAPDFWSNPEKSQRVMQERKRLEESINNDGLVHSMTEDLDTMFELAREGGERRPRYRARDDEIRRNAGASPKPPCCFRAKTTRAAAIMTIHPGAGGGTESQDWAEMLLCACIACDGRSGKDSRSLVTDRQEGEGAGIKSVTFEVQRRECLRTAAIRRSACIAWCVFRAFRFERAPAHLVRFGVRLSDDRRRNQDRYQTGRSAHR